MNSFEMFVLNLNQSLQDAKYERLIVPILENVTDWLHKLWFIDK